MLHPPLPLILRIECREPCEINGYEIHLKTKVTVNAKLMKRFCMLAWCYEFYFRKFFLQLNWIRWDSLWIYPFWGRKEDVPRSNIWTNQYWTFLLLNYYTILIGSFQAEWHPKTRYEWRLWLGCPKEKKLEFGS